MGSSVSLSPSSANNGPLKMGLRIEALVNAAISPVISVLFNTRLTQRFFTQLD
jgi:hypothetical protein